jgi:hypothetical protein
MMSPQHSIGWSYDYMLIELRKINHMNNTNESKWAQQPMTITIYSLQDLNTQKLKM